MPEGTENAAESTGSAADTTVQTTPASTEAGGESTTTEPKVPAEINYTSSTDTKGEEGQQQNSEGEGDTSSEANTASEEAEAETGAPETYEAFTSPEGAHLGDDVVKSYGEIAKTMNLSQENAQKMIDTVAPAIVKGQQAKLADLRAEWKQQTVSDEMLGGTKHEANMAVVAKAMDTFGTPEFKKLLDETGFGDHPEMNRLLFQVGSKISEDKIVGGSGNTPERIPGQIQYNSTKK